jgi:hypothetical protein
MLTFIPHQAAGAASKTHSSACQKPQATMSFSKVPPKISNSLYTNTYIHESEDGEVWNSTHSECEKDVICEDVKECKNNDKCETDW